MRVYGNCQTEGVEEMKGSGGAHYPPLRPDVVDKDGPGWSLKKVMDFVASELNIETGTHITRKAKMISPDYEKASEILVSAEKVFARNADKLQDTANNLQNNIKKVSGNVRKAADDLASGLMRVEKVANFSNLERYVDLLERAATAMATLAELEKEGKLNKISDALK